MIATVTLNPSIDEVFEVRDLSASDSSRALRITKSAAGKGVNVSKFLIRLGAAARTFTLLGGVMGKEYERLAALEKLTLHARWVKEDTRVNVTIDDFKSGREIRVLAPGPCAGLADARKLQRMALAARPKPFALVLSGSLPPGLDKGTYAEWVRASRRNGVRCLVDADGEAFRLAVRARPWAVKPNHFELAGLFRTHFRTEKRIIHSALSLVAERGIEIAAVSLERRGVLVVSRAEKPFFVRPPYVKVHSRVGAGDAFVAGLLRGLELGKPLAEAARLGAGTSSARVAGIENAFGMNARRLAARSRVEWAKA